MNQDKANLSGKILDLYGVTVRSIPMHEVTESSTPPSALWGELPGLLNYEVLCADLESGRDTNTLLCYTDFLGASYYLAIHNDTLILAGPVTFKRTDDTSYEEIMSIGNISSDSAALFNNYLTSLPIMDKQPIFTAFLVLLLSEIYEEAFANVINRTFTRELAIRELKVRLADGYPKDGLLNMHYLEDRYDNESHLLVAVASGDEAKALKCLAGMQRYYIPSRIPNSFRDGQNMCISFNTLLRKTIEQAGVHPYYIDQISSSIVRRIEASTTRDQLNQLLVDAVKDYCSICAEYLNRNYSPTISRMVTYIGTHLGEDLTLSTLAELFNLNSSHLSASFKKETGETLTEYVNKTRIVYARRLLTGTTMSIKEIAQAVGIPDINYFTRLFRKHVGSTPAAYRKAHSGK